MKIVLLKKFVHEIYIFFRTLYILKKYCVSLNYRKNNRKINYTKSCIIIFAGHTVCSRPLISELIF